MNLLRHRRVLRRLIGAAVLALVLGQWSVLVHSVEHARAALPAEASNHDDHGWGHQAGTSACDLVDHLLAGQAPAGEPPAVPCPAPDGTPSAALASSNGPGPASRAYEARGPPRA